MKKSIAFLFLFLICLTTFSGLENVGDDYELVKSGETIETDSKEAKKDKPEFTILINKKPCAAACVRFLHSTHDAFIHPQPVINMQSPPPDASAYSS
jgi:hypothetical protein